MCLGNTEHIGYRSTKWLVLGSQFSWFQYISYSVNFLGLSSPNHPTFGRRHFIIVFPITTNSFPKLFSFGLFFDDINSWPPSLTAVTNPDSIHVCTSNSKKWMLLQCKLYSWLTLSFLILKENFPSYIAGVAQRTCYATDWTIGEAAFGSL